MKILYVGTVDRLGTCYSRLCALRELESDVHTFEVLDHLDWVKLPPWHRAFETHVLQGPRLWRAHAALEARCRELRPDLVWVDAAEWLETATLRRLRAQGCFLVHHVTDALEPRSWRMRLRRRRMRDTVHEYDVFLTTNADDHARLAPGAPNAVLLTDLGYDHRRFDASPLPEPLAKQWDDGLVFIGHYEPRTEAGILALVEAGLPVTVYGHQPWFESKHRQRLAERLRPRLDNEDYVHALKGARVGLCWVSELNYNQTASRSFEIPASGTFLLAMRTPQHLEAYEEGKEAEFFGDHRELVEKARYYLEHEEEREAIARRGTQRCLASGYSWDALMQRDWPRVRKIYEEQRSARGSERAR